MVETKRLGLTVLAEGGRDPVANIVFIHGLLGDPRCTWEKRCSPNKKRGPPDNIASQASGPPQKKSRMFHFWDRKSDNTDKQPEVAAVLAMGLEEEASNDPKSVFWPEELLPRDIPNARIFTYGYNAGIVGELLNGPDMNNVSQHANDLMICLRSELTNKKPIIFVAHSLGGIIIKDTLRRSKTSHVPGQSVIYDNTAAIIFLGTPHRGSGFAGLGEIVTRVAKLILLESNSHLIGSIDYNSEILSNIQEEFRKMITEKDIQLHSFRESRGLSSLKGLSSKVVDDFSSIIEDPKEVVESIDANHMEMTKFLSVNDQGYCKVQRALSGFIDQILERSKALMLSGSKTELLNASREVSVRSSMLSGSKTELLNASGEADVRRHLDLVADNHKETLEWILQHPSYEQWRTGNHEYPILWMPGQLGSGKSTALKFLIKRLSCSIEPSNVVFFFCDGRDSTKSTEMNLLRSIVRQILQQDAGLQTKLAENVSNVNADLSLTKDLWELMELSCLALAQSCRPTYILIDAVDELQDLDRAAFLERFEQLIRDNRRCEGARRSNVRFLLTSRPWTIVKDHLGSFLALEFKRERVQLDIKTMLTDVVQSFARRENFPGEVASKIIDTTSDKARGMFLWACLAWNHFKDIKDAWSNRVVQGQLSELDSLPPGIRPLYEHLLQRLQPDKFAWNVFKWLTYAERALRSSEFDIGLALLRKPRDSKSLELVYDISRSIQQLCGPFIRLGESEDIVDLAHHSMRTFFLESYPQLMLSGNVMIMDACVTYLCFNDIPWGPVDYVDNGLCLQHIAEYGFLEYALFHWYSHYKRAEASGGLVCTITMQNCDAVANKQAANRCLAFVGLPQIDHYTPHKGGRTALHIAARWGWSQAIEALLANEGVDASRLDDDGWSPLHVASYWSFSVIAKQLIEHGGWKKAFHTNTTGWHAFHFLVKQDLEELACMILERFERLPESINDLDPEGNGLLHCLIRRGWNLASKIMIEKPGIELNIPDRRGKSPLHYAAVTSDTTISRMLIAGGAKISHVDLNHATALMYALDDGMAGTIDLLITKGASCDGVDMDGRSTLHYAVSRDWVSVVKRLVENGADIKHPDNSGILPIHMAALHGNAKLVRWFMDQPDIQINTKSHNGDSVIYWTAKGRQNNILDFLSTAADIEMSLKDQFERNILHVSIPWARPDIIRQILKLNVVKLDAKDHTGSTCLHRAAWDASDKTLELVLEEYRSQGLDIDVVDVKGRTALHYAAMNGAYAVQRLLLGKADQNTRDADGLLPLDMAILWHKIEVLRVLDLSLANSTMLVNYIRRSPPPFATNLLHSPDSFFYKIRRGDRPHIHIDEASDRDVFRLSEIFTNGAQREVFGQLEWDPFYNYVRTQEGPLERKWITGPGTLDSWNAVADGEDAFLYYQSWRRRDITRVGQQYWTGKCKSGLSREESKPPSRRFLSYLEDLTESVWTKDPIRSSEEAQIVRYKETN